MTILPHTALPAMVYPTLMITVVPIIPPSQRNPWPTVARTATAVKMSRLPTMPENSLSRFKRMQTPIRNIVKKILLLITTLIISACSTTGKLSPISSEDPIGGTVTRGLVEPFQVEVTLSGKTYRGEWRTLAAPESSGASLALHRRHVGKVQSALRADDNTQLVCSWFVHSQIGEGSCVGPDNREYELRVD